ncbi:MAG: glycosyltransferase family 9 protein [Sedimentisphaerales bacterium]|nr:glycosyltransferase family 9 protein [Sedimentisphaerales bacterium]
MNKSLKNREFNNILIIKPSSLGDVVRCLPVLAGLRQRYRTARISWLIRPDCAAVLENSPNLDELIEFDRRHYGRIGRHRSATIDFLVFLNQLRKKNFDLILDLQGLFRSGFISWCSLASVRIGFAQAREFAPVFYTHRVNMGRKSEHVVDSYWRFAEKLGFGELPKTFEVSINPEDELAGQGILRQHLSGDGKFMVMLPGGTAPAKRWSASKFAGLAEMISSRYDIRPVLLGAGSCERDIARQIVNESKCIVIDLVDRTNLSQAMAILKRASLVVGNDSGPLHIGAALGVAVIGIYGPTDPSVVGPYGQLGRVVEAASEIPRNRRYSKNHQHRIDNITIDRVFNEVARILEK